MHNLLITLCVGSLLVGVTVFAENESAFTYKFAFSIDRSELDDLNLGFVPDPGDPELERLEEEDFEFEFGFEYEINDHLNFFFIGALIDETESVKPDGERDHVAGLERKEIGVGVYFGEEIKSELNIGRMEFTSISEWWLWWDEELDAIRLESGYGRFEIVLGIAEEQLRESTAQDFIDPEIDGIRRIIANLSWDIDDNQSLYFYYLDQQDNSDSFYDGFGSFEDCDDGPPLLVCESEDFDRIDEEDADLTWTGISYLGEFEFEVIGEFEIELHYARVSGDEVVYDFDDPDPVTDFSRVTGRQENRVSGSAQSYLINWTPAALEDWSFIIGNARGSGDGNPDDGREKSFRQTGLQGESAVYGELYQPELSNLDVQVIGVEWEFYDGFEIALLNYDYEQDKLADEMRGVVLEVDPSGMSRDLGRELDLVLTIEAYEGLEVRLVYAEFEAGKAYDDGTAGGDFNGDTARYVNVEMSCEF